MHSLRIRLLGMLSVASGGGAEITLTRKHKLLLAVLALAGPDGLSREKLVELLWQDRSEEQARASLRQALAATGKALGSCRQCLRAEPDRIALNAPTVEVDAHEFEALAGSEAAEDRDRALALYLGDLLDGVRLKEDAFEAWLRPTRERLREKAIALLGRRLEAAREGTQVVDVAGRLLAFEPANEAAHRALMRAYASQGRETAALKQFLVCRDLLSRELGIGPSGDTIALYNEIRRRRSPVEKPTRGDEGMAIAPVVQAEAPWQPMTKPTITVMPFENLSEDPGQDYFAAGITNDIVSALLRHRWLTVIGVSNMLDIGRYSMILGDRIVEANVDYLVTGSVRKAGNRLRINVQMLDADSNEHIWSENYDRRPGDVFEIQDQITGMIAGHIDVEINANERRRVLLKSTQSLGAWECYHLGMAHFFRFSRDDFRAAQRLFARSLEFDPEFGEGHAWGHTSA